MKNFPIPERNFLFLQGPAGPLFPMLAEQLRLRGCTVHRINFNGGDRGDWPDGVDYRGLPSRWPLFLDRFLRTHRITDILLFGDCRPIHIAALGMAKLRKINVHVLEEGYIRPDWMTLEPDGVNGHSSLSRDAQWFVRTARNLPPIPDLPPVTANFKRRKANGLRYYNNVFMGRLRYPFYRSHRVDSPLIEGFGWLYKYSRAKRRAREAAAALKAIENAPYFLFPLQLSADFQIRIHSPFADMQTAAEYVFESFARHAPKDVMMLVKEHPLDSSLFNWRRFVQRKARALGVEDRILHIEGGDLYRLSAASRGMVCVNSTSATLVLGIGKPVFVTGEAIYHIPGITHQGLLDGFWSAPEAPDPAIYEAFKRVLHDRCLVRGGLASRYATNLLVASVIARLTEDPAHAVLSEELIRVLP